MVLKLILYDFFDFFLFRAGFSNIKSLFERDNTRADSRAKKDFSSSNTFRYFYTQTSPKSFKRLAFEGDCRIK
jgi:hypothetical protein